MLFKTREIKISWLFLFLMMGHLIVVSSFKHFHIVDSEIITHSHPCKTVNHTHTDFEFFQLQLFSYFDFEKPFIQQVADVLFAEKIALFCPNFQLNTIFFFLHYSLRAPPTCVF